MNFGLREEGIVEDCESDRDVGELNVNQRDIKGECVGDPALIAYQAQSILHQSWII